MRAEVMSEATTFAHTTPHESEARLRAWFEEAIGYKVRYVPTTLPDLLKTTAVIDHEQRTHAASTPEQKIEVAASRLAWTRDPSTNIEVCTSRQSIEGFARGEGVWAELAVGDRLDQLDRMIDLTGELYPSLRWFMFDGLQRYAAPVTVFGPIRAVLYLGQMYLVLSSAEHVRELARHFDDHIRAATVQPPDVPAFISELRRELASR